MYDGSKPLAEYLCHFRVVAAVNRWSEYEKGVWSAIVNTQRRQIEVEDGAFPVAERPAQQVHLVHEDDAEDGKSLKKGDQIWELEERQTLGEEGRGMVVESILAPASASDAKAPESVTGTKHECLELEEKQISQEGAEGHGTVDRSVLAPISAGVAETSSRVPLPSVQVPTVAEGHIGAYESCVATLSRDFRVPGQLAVLLPVDLQGGTEHSQWILEGSEKFEERTGLMTGRVCVLAGQGSAVLEATNSGPGEVCLFRGTKIGTGTLVVDVNTPQVCRMVRGEESPKERDESLVREIVAAMPAEATASEQQKVSHMLHWMQAAFQAGPGDTGGTDMVTHKIDTGDHQPIRQRYRRLPPDRRQIV